MALELVIGPALGCSMATLELEFLFVDPSPTGSSYFCGSAEGTTLLPGKELSSSR